MKGTQSGIRLDLDQRRGKFRRRKSATRMRNLARAIADRTRNAQSIRRHRRAVKVNIDSKIAPGRGVLEKSAAAVFKVAGFRAAGLPRRRPFSNRG
jgi:hypothetical protein